MLSIYLSVGSYIIFEGNVIQYERNNEKDVLQTWFLHWKILLREQQKYIRIILNLLTFPFIYANVSKTLPVYRKPTSIYLKFIN